MQTAISAKLSIGWGRDKVMERAFAKGRVLELCQLNASLLATHYLTPALFQNYTCQGDCL